VVTLDALVPFRAPLWRAADDPQPLPYLNDAHNLQHGALDIDLEVLLQTAAMRQQGRAPEVIARSNAANASYWTLAQLVAHHTVNGCALSAGDLLGSGTLSGPGPGQAGSLLELTQGGTQPIRLANGQTRLFLEDGDSITLRGSCQRPGFRRLGFGACTATVLPSLPWAASTDWEGDDGAV
jgi:fumarylacetoacetase